MLQAAFFSFWRARNRMILRFRQSNPNFVESEEALCLEASERCLKGDGGTGQRKTETQWMACTVKSYVPNSGTCIWYIPNFPPLCIT